MESDFDYYRRRLNEERNSAAEADRDDVRSVHEKLAKMYEARVRKLSRESPALAPDGGQAPVVRMEVFSGA